MSKRKQADLSKFGFYKKSAKSSENENPIDISDPANATFENAAAAVEENAAFEENPIPTDNVTSIRASSVSESATPLSQHASDGPSTAGESIESPCSMGMYLGCMKSATQWETWRERNPWLVCHDGKFGCQVCKDAKRLFLSEKGVQLSEEWVSGSVCASSTKQMLKKLYKHRDSSAHQKATDIAHVREKGVLPNIVSHINADLLAETSNAFRTAYLIAKERLPFSKMDRLVSLQELNGTKMGKVHRSDHSCANMTEHIANETKKKMISTLKSKESRVSITIDESTAYGFSYLIVYVRADVTGNGDIENMFLDLVELEHGTTAESVYGSLKESLNKSGLDDQYLRKCLVSIATDGASVMTGREAQERFPQCKSRPLSCAQIGACRA